MKIITLHQPWASLIALGLKQYETRSWSTPYRGKLAIHAGKTNQCKSPFQTINLFSSQHGLSRNLIEKLDPVIMDGNKLPTGAIIAVADLDCCLSMVDQYIPGRHGTICIKDQDPLELAVGEWATGRFAWQLENIKPLPNPIPFTGKQGLRNLDLRTIEKIEGLLKITA